MARPSEPRKKPNSTTKPAHKKKNATAGGKRISKSKATPRINVRSREVASGPMTRLRKSTFQFSRLPGELRNMIYRAALNFDSLEQAVTESFYFTTGELKLLPKTAPPLLLLNRQIHFESKEVLYRENTLTIEVFPPADDRESPDVASAFKHLVSRGVLSQIQHIVFRKVDQQSVSSWMATLHDLDSLIGYFVSVWTTDGLGLKTLRIEVGHNELQEHIDACARHGGICHAQVFLNSILVSLKNLQYLESVEFIGPISQMHNADEVKRWMTFPKSRFLQMPSGVRNLIYGYVLQETIANRQLHAYQLKVVGRPKDLVKRHNGSHHGMSAVVNSNTAPRNHSWSTGEETTISVPPPPILMVNKQLSSEVKAFLQNVPLVFKEPLNLFLGTSTLELKSSKNRVFLDQRWQNTIRKVTNVTLEIDVSQGPPQKWKLALRSFGIFCCEYHIEAPAVRLLRNRSLDTATYTRRMKGIAEVLEQELKLKVDKIVYLDEFTESEMQKFAATEHTLRPRKRSGQKRASPHPTLGGLRLPGASSSSEVGSNS